MSDISDFLNILGIKTVEVRALFICRHCKKTDEKQILLTREALNREENVDYTDHSYFHRCRSGEYGVMMFTGFDVMDDSADGNQ